MRATIVIPTRNRSEVLAQSLPVVIEQAGADSEVIVVDDGSTDATAETVAVSGGGRVLCLRTSHGGAGAARNRALEIARGEVVVFLDDDAFIPPGFLARHLATHRRSANLLVAGGIVEVRQVPGRVDLARVQRRSGYHRHPMPGGNSSVRRAHLLAAGGFDESFDSYGWQDQELAERLLGAGLVRQFVWGAAILHYKSAALVLDPRHELERELERGRMGARFYAKHPRLLVGITTKLWPPLRALDSLLTRLLPLEDTTARILRGDDATREFRGARARLLRAHVEISAGRRELSRLVARDAAAKVQRGADCNAKSASEANVG